MQSVVHRLIQCVICAPGRVVLGAVLLAGLSLWYTSRTLEFETSRNALASSSARYIQLDDALSKEFDKITYLVVAIDAPHPQRSKQFVEVLATRLQADTTHVKEVIKKIDMSRLQGKKLLYLSPEELRDLRQRLEDAEDFLIDLSMTPGLVQLLTSVNREIAKAVVGSITGGLLQTTTPDLPADSALDVSFLTALLSEMQQAITTPETDLFRSPWSRFFLDGSDVFDQEGYLTSDNERLFFVLVDAHSTPGSFVDYAAALQAIRAHIQALHDDFPDVLAGVTGGDALNTDEMLAAQRDTVVATVLALIGVAVLFIAAFRQVWRPLMVVATLIVAVCWTLGFTTAVVGQLNILTIAFLPILVGLGIDFGIHLIARYSEARADHGDFDAAIQMAYLQTGPGIAAAALTTAVAFYAVVFTDFRGLTELGLISGSGLLLCLLASFTMLPALLALRERRRQVPTGVWQAAAPDSLLSAIRFPRLQLSVIGLLTLAGVAVFPLPRFDYNLLNLQARETESVVWEHRLLAESNRSSWHAVTVADSWEALYRKEAELSALPVVDRVSSLASLIPRDQDVRLPLVKALAPHIEDITSNWEDVEPVDLDKLHRILKKIRFKLQRGTSEWEPSKRPTETALNAARVALLALQERLQIMPPQVVHAALNAFQLRLMRDFADKLDLLQQNLNPTPIDLADVPTYLRRIYVSSRGRFLLQVFSRESIWERRAMHDFVTQVQTVDADITGAPIVAYYSIGQIQRGYVRGGLYALIAILGIMLLLFRQLKPILIALLPLVFGGLWTVVCMALLDLQLNLANLIIVPLFLGIAVDDGIHLVHRWREESSPTLAPLTQSTGKAIVLTSLTSMVGLGSLMVAQHAGIYSLGLLTTISIGCSLIATLGVLPLAASIFPFGKRRPGS